MRLVEIAQAFEIAMRVELRLPPGLAAVRCRIAVIRPQINGLAEPVGSIDAEAFPAREDKGRAGGVNPSERAEG